VASAVQVAREGIVEHSRPNFLDLFVAYDDDDDDDDEDK
jgi:hypothetical protein